jgi:hypothetical protein
MIALRLAGGFGQVRLNAVEFSQLLDFTEIGMTSIASLGLNVQLLIRRSLVRVQVGEPEFSTQKSPALTGWAFCFQMPATHRNEAPARGHRHY